MKPKEILLLAVCISIPIAAGLLGSLFTAGSIDSWYQNLNKPSFNPPNWIFSPVWTILYIMMGISLYLAIRKNQNPYLKIIFLIQLSLNILWSFLFFTAKNPLLAFIDIIFLWIAILINIFIFYKSSKTASYLLIPYLLWVSFASFLNLAIVLMN